MFNNTNQINNTSLHINAVGGTLLKNHRNSFFLRCHMKSNMADKLFQMKPKYGDNYSGEDVVILQTMLCGDSELLFEVVKLKDYNDSFEQKQ